MIKHWKKTITALISGIFLMSYPLSIEAAEIGRASVSVENTSAYVFLQDGDIAKEYTAQVGNVAAEVKEVKELSALPAPLETIICIDNSDSIKKDDRQLINELVMSLVGSKMPGETFTIATMSADVTYLAEDLSDYMEIKDVMDEMTYQLQTTKLTDCAYELIADAKQKDPSVLRRIILIADGNDERKLGYTKDELKAQIISSDIPIYAVGCVNTTPEGNDQLEQLFAMSRGTLGSTVYLGNTRKISDIVGTLQNMKDCVRVKIDLPNEVCDGSERSILVSDGETNYIVSAAMPFGKKEENKIEPSLPAVEEMEDITPVEEINAVDAFWTNIDSYTQQHPWLKWVFYILGATAIALIGGAIVQSLKKKEESSSAEKPDSEGSVGSPITPSVTSTASDKYDQDTEDRTVMMRRCVKTVVLEDMNDISKHFELRVDRPVTVGRKTDRNLILAYDTSVSREQCVFYMKGTDVYLSNSSNSNPTKLDGTVVGEDRKVQNGSILEIGKLQMLVKIQS